MAETTLKQKVQTRCEDSERTKLDGADVRSQGVAPLSKTWMMEEAQISNQISNNVSIQMLKKKT